MFSKVAYRVETVQDFLIKLGIKPLMHLLEKGPFALNNVTLTDLLKFWTTSSKFAKFVLAESSSNLPKLWTELTKIGHIFSKRKFSKKIINISWSPNHIFFTEIFFWKDSTNFRRWKMTLKVRILQSLTRLFIILVSLMMSLFNEKMPIFNRCISGSMSNLIEKSWKVTNVGGSEYTMLNGLKLFLNFHVLA